MWFWTICMFLLRNNSMNFREFFVYAFYKKIVASFCFISVQYRYSSYFYEKIKSKFIFLRNINNFRCCYCLREYKKEEFVSYALHS